VIEETTMTDDRKREDKQGQGDEPSRGQFGGLRGDLGPGAGRDIEDVVEDDGRPAPDVIDRDKDAPSGEGGSERGLDSDRGKEDRGR
jgi:hypothetical protein